MGLFDGVEVIRVELDPDDTRVCDYCNVACAVFEEPDIPRPQKPEEIPEWVRRRVKEGRLNVVTECHVSDYGLLCEKCKEDINREGDQVPIYKSYRIGDTYDWGIEK